jgi:hypothetical protein
MSNTTYQWQINKLECLPTEQQIVSKVYWSLTAKRGEYQCNCFGEIELDYENNSVFIEYSELTEGTVLNWVKENLKDTVNEEKYLKEVLSTRLSGLENSVTLELPWNESQE